MFSLRERGVAALAETNGQRRLSELSAVQVRQVIERHVADEGAANFVIASAAVQPSQEKKQLKERRKTNNDPVGIHLSVDP